MDFLHKKTIQYSLINVGIYNKESEESLLWNDIDLNIDWKVKKPIISEKDKISKSFNNFKSQF